MINVIPVNIQMTEIVTISIWKFHFDVYLIKL